MEWLFDPDTLSYIAHVGLSVLVVSRDPLGIWDCWVQHGQTTHTRFGFHSLEAAQAWGEHEGERLNDEDDEHT